MRGLGLDGPPATYRIRVVTMQAGRLRSSRSSHASRIFVEWENENAALSALRLTARSSHQPVSHNGTQDGWCRC